MRKSGRSAAGYRRTMASGTHLRVLAPECRRIEAGSMRIEATATLGRVAAEAVPFGVTGDAALQVLARRLPVTQQKRPLRVVVPGVQCPSSTQPGLHMAVGAELSSVVAVAATGFA